MSQRHRLLCDGQTCPRERSSTWRRFETKRGADAPYAEQRRPRPDLLQYLHQLETDIRHAVLGNAGTLIAFRLGPEDAAFIAREFEPYLDHLDLLNLPNYEIYVKLMRDGAPLKPFSATTVPWPELATAFVVHQPAAPPPTSAIISADKRARALLTS